MSDVSQSSVDSPQVTDPAPVVAPDPSCEAVPVRGPIGIIFALRIEATRLLKRLEDKTTILGRDVKITSGTLAGRSIVVAISGPGAKAARRAATAMIDGHQPRIVVASGLAGALERSLPLGRIVRPDLLVDAAGRRLAVDTFPAFEEDADSPPESLDEDKSLAMVTVDRVASGPAAKAQLREETGARSVDMETFYTAEVCCREQVPFTVARVIVDPLDRELPDDVEALLRARSPMRQAGAALRTLWRNPARAKDLYLLKKETDQALESLDAYLARLLGTYPVDVKSTDEPQKETGEPTADSLIDQIGPPREV